MMKKNVIWFSICIISLICSAVFLGVDSVQAEELIQVPVLIQVSSKVSDGRLELSQIVSIAKESGMKAVVFTDRFIMRWEYGIWPLRNIVKKAVINNSITVYGMKKYIEAIEKLQVENSDMVLIPGVETTPFYYWSGSFFKMDMVLHDAHKHMLVFGLNKVMQFNNIPTVNNRFTKYNRFDAADILFFWPFLLIFAGIIIIKNDMKFLGVGVIVLGVLFCVNNVPFKKPIFDQYHGEQAVLPYQTVIDYVNEQQGMSFWSHPEAEYELNAQHVSVITNNHAEDLLKTKDYKGFCVFPEGYKQVGVPGGIWDTLLMEYIQGKRKNPVWAIAGLAFDYQGDLDKKISGLRNTVLVNQLDKENVLKAISAGRLYASRGEESSKFCFTKFEAEDKYYAMSKTIGQTLMLKGDAPLINIECAFNEGTEKEIEIKLIRNGEVVRNFKKTTPANIKYIDIDFVKHKKAYYRVEIKGQGLHVITNPIFIEKDIRHKT